MSVNEFDLQGTEDRKPDNLPGERRDEESTGVLELELNELRAVAGGPGIRNGDT